MTRKIWYTKTQAEMAAIEQDLKRYGIEESPDRYGVTTYAIREPYNPELHDHLIDLGFNYDPMAAEFDDGDAENGPGAWWHPPYDQYTASDEYISIDDGGHVVHRENRDLEFEAWIDEQQAHSA